MKNVKLGSTCQTEDIKPGNNLDKKRADDTNITPHRRRNRRCECWC